MLLGFGLSGVASLIFEIAWTRTLATVMGSSTYAMSTVLGAFMGGLAVGALGGARLAPRLKNLPAAFAVCELGIGFTGRLAGRAYGVNTAGAVLGALLKPPQVPFFSYGWASRFGDVAFARRIAAEVTRAGDRDVVFRREGVEGADLAPAAARCYGAADLPGLHWGSTGRIVPSKRAPERLTCRSSSSSTDSRSCSWGSSWGCKRARQSRLSPLGPSG